MTTNLTLSAQITKAINDKSATALKALRPQLDALDIAADSKAVESRMTAWITRGEWLIACVTLSSIVCDDIHTVAQADIAKAAAEIVGVTIDQDTAKKRVRAALYVTPTLLESAQTKLGKADGPVSTNAIDIVRWCQAQDERGRAAATRKGKAVPTKAAAVKAVSAAKAAADKSAADVAAKAAADAKLTLGQSIVTANDDSVHGPLTAQRWVALDSKALDQVIEIAQAVKAAKAAAAKAAKAAAPKAAKAPKAAAAAAIDTSDAAFQAAVAAAVAAVMAANG